MSRSRLFILVIILALAMSFLPTPDLSVAQVPEEVTRDTLYIPGEVVITFEGSLSKETTAIQAQALAGQVGAQVIDQAPGIALLGFDPEADVMALSEQLAVLEGVQVAGPNYISWIPEEDLKAEPYAPTEVTRTNADGETMTLPVSELASMRTIKKGAAIPTYPVDTYYPWGFFATDSEIIWIEAKVSPEVCVIDTGADIAHPDLSGKVVNGYDFVNGDAIANDDNGHGTHVAGVIAAKANNKLGVTGISNGKVVAVKALTDQGWGTTFDIIAAINFCANRSTVKVINMSLTSNTADANEKSALTYAINTKGKLVVASAGNNGNSVRQYPAGWADDASIGHSLISVGAATYDSTWVDKNSNSIEDAGEFYSRCAPSFSNFGSWVEMVAPGVSVISTTPVSYPFAANYYGGTSDYYDYMSGTSMAAPFVAAGAARLWSIHMVTGTPNNWTNSTVAYYLKQMGDSLTTNVTGGPAGRPWCWPSSMVDSSYLNIATAMFRGAITATAVDAITGLPLTGAKVYAYKAGTTTVGDYAQVATKTSRYVDLINLPFFKLGLDGLPVDVQYYDLGINKSGYTTGTPKYLTGITTGFGYYNYDQYTAIAVPPNKGYGIVLTWDYYASGNLDLFLWMPYANPGAIIAPPNWSYPYTVGDYWTTPFARYSRDAGTGLYDVGVESIIVKNNGATPVYPGWHDILVYDRNTWGANLNDSDAIVRVWLGGLIKQTVMISNSCSNETNEDWWYVGWFYKNGTATNYTTVNNCGTSLIRPWSTSESFAEIDKEQ